MKPAISGSSGRSSGTAGVAAGPLAGGTQVEALVAHGRHHAQPAQRHVAPRASARHHQLARPVGVGAERPHHHRHRAVGPALEAERDHAPGRAGVAAGEGDDAQVAAGRRHGHHGDVGQHRLAHRHRQLVGEQIGQHRRRSRAAGPARRRRRRASRGRCRCPARDRRGQGALGLVEVARRARAPRKTSRGFGQVPLGNRPRAGVLGQPPERELADRGLVPLADEVEDARALRDVVVRLVRPALRARAADRAARRNSPQAPGVVRGSMRPSTAAMRAAASALRPASSSASAAISSASSRSAGGAPVGGDDRVGLSASASAAPALAHAEPGAYRPAPTTRTTGWSAGRRRRRLRRRG